MKFYSWNERVRFLKSLSNSVIEKFGEQDYNVFVFGSFLREDYNPETSDIDLAIYAKSERVTFDLAEFIEQYLNERNVPSSILEIFLDQVNAFVYLEPLELNVSFTEYYPIELKEFYWCLRNRYITYHEEEMRFREMRKCILESRRKLGV